tara:strand:- start:509 stop:772 length:264 start_codon:yes stop_codon:yes gene_type:complete
MYQRDKTLSISKLPFKSVTKCNTSLPIRVDPSFKELMDQKKPIYEDALGKDKVSNTQVTAIIVKEHKAMEKRLKEMKEEIDCRINFF